MKTIPKGYCSLLAAAGLLGGFGAQAGFVQNPSFEANYNDTWPHYGTIDLWSGGSGVNQADGPFHNAGTPIPDGLRAAFRQGSGDLSQDIVGLTPGKRYILQFAYDARACCGGSIDLATRINDVELDKIANVKPVTGGATYLYRTVAFTPEADTVKLTFTATSSGDATVLLDSVSIVQRDANQLALLNPSFEASGDVPDPGVLSPGGLAGWIASGTYGVSLAGTGPADNGTNPDQDHVGFLQGASSLEQSFRVVAGKPYQLTLSYNAKTGNSPRIQVKAGTEVLFEEDVAPVGGANAYRKKTVAFTPSDVTAKITISQTKDGEQSLLLDDVQVTGEVPSEFEPVTLAPEVAELGIGEQVDISLTVAPEILAVRAVDIVLQTANGGIARFVDASGALPLRATVTFAKGGPAQQTFRIQALARGTANIQVIDSGGIPVRNQLTASVVSAPIRNPSFESSGIPAGVGHGAIPSWTGGSGLNGSAGPFADNGLIPDRKQVAFQQGAGALAQEIRGLVPGQNYWLRFMYNIRNCCPPGESRMDVVVNLGGKEVANLKGVTAVTDPVPYHAHSVAFVADGPTALLEFRTSPVGDATFLLDAVSVVPRPSGQVVVFNPSFEASGSVFPFPGYHDAVAGWTVGGGNRGANIDGAGPFSDNGRANAGDLVAFMQGNGSFLSQTLQNLVPGTKYVTAFLMNARACCGGEDSALVVSWDDAPILEESFQPVGGTNPYRVGMATFTANGSEGTLKFQGATPEGDHTLLLDNVMVFPEAGSPPVILGQPRDVRVASGGATTFAVLAAGTGNVTYQWKKNGQTLSGRTENALVLDPVAPGDAGTYTVDIRNSGGTVSSAPAVLAVLETIPGTYDTGTGNDRVILPDGALDPHYTLVRNPDAATSTVAYVQDGSLWPIVEGPWLANNDVSKWIGPRVDPTSPAGGEYIYRLYLDLAGYDASTVVLSGSWASDNSVELVVNGLGTGVNQAGFGALAAFSVNGVFRAGLNQVDFKVNNGDASGPTGLRVEGLTALGAKGGGTPGPAPSLSASRTATGAIRLAWPSSASGYVLQSSTAVNSGWANEPGPVLVEGTSNVVIVGASTGQKFFRLRR